MKKQLYMILALLIFSVGCTDRDDNVSLVNIRIKNNNNFTYDMVQVGGETQLHENIGADSFSDYLEYEEAYRYAFVEIDTAGTKYTLQPIDFVGETPLSPGFYTYELELGASGNITLDFKND